MNLFLHVLLGISMITVPVFIATLAKSWVEDIRGEYE